MAIIIANLILTINFENYVGTNHYYITLLKITKEVLPHTLTKQYIFCKMTYLLRKLRYLQENKYMKTELHIYNLITITLNMKSLICSLKKIIWSVVPDKFMYYVYVDYKCNSHHSIFEIIFSIKSYNIFFSIFIKI